MRNLRIAASLFFILLIMNGLVAQSNKSDAVYLTNGSILRGKIIENVVGKYVKIEMVGSSILVIAEQDVDHIMLREAIPLKKRDAKPQDIEVLPAISFYGGSKFNSGFTTITSYRFPFRLSVGAGIGVEWFNVAGLPVFADVRYNVLKGGLSPYVYSQAGYSMPLATNPTGDYSTYYGGPLFAAGVGLRKNFANRNAFVFSLGYRFQQMRTDYGYYWYSQTYDTKRYDRFNRFAFSLGFIFD